MITHNQQDNHQLTKHLRQRQNNRPNIDLSTLVYGKIPPQAKDLEDAILGAIMLDKNAFLTAVEILKDGRCFYVEAHQIIFDAFKNLSANSMPIDILTVVEALKAMGKLELIGGAFYISKLTNTVVSGAHIEAHCRIILQKFIQREVIRISGELINDAYDDSTDVFDLFEKAESGIYEISTQHFKSDFNKLSTGLPELYEKIERMKLQDGTLTGVPTGFVEMDKVTHGWQPTDLIIIAARPSVGKTAFALNLAHNALKSLEKPTAVGFFSLEMSRVQLLKRMVSMDSGIWMNALSSGKVWDTEILHRSGERIEKMPMYVDDTAALNLFELRSKARRMVSKYGVGLIIIDYLQLMSGDNDRGGNREQEVSRISRGLKALAKELQVPIIALSQLSRMVETRGKGQKVPQLSDLRESGAIEQDADIVMFLYRPPEDEVKDDPELQNKGMAKIAKHRDGSLESFAFNVNHSIQKWDEIGVLDERPWQKRNDTSSKFTTNEVPSSFIPVSQLSQNNFISQDEYEMPF